MSQLTIFIRANRFSVESLDKNELCHSEETATTADNAAVNSLKQSKQSHSLRYFLCASGGNPREKFKKSELSERDVQLCASYTVVKG